MPNIGKLKPGTIHMDGMWTNYLQPWQGIAYNPKAMQGGRRRPGPRLYDPKFKGRVIVPSLQNTEGLANLFMAAFLATGKPMPEAQKDVDAGFKKLEDLKPNLLTVYTQMPQAYNLLEQGEAYMISSAISRSRCSASQAGAPVDIAVPRKASSPCRRALPSSRAARSPTSPPPTSTRCWAPRCRPRSSAPPSRCRPTWTTPCRAGMPTNATIHGIDWEFVADNRADWVKRWDRDMAM